MNQAELRAEYKDANGGKELDKHCATRFCTEVPVYSMAESAKANLESLKKTVVSKFLRTRTFAVPSGTALPA